MATQKIIFNTDVDTTKGLSLTGDKLSTKVDGTTIEINGSGELTAIIPDGIAVSATAAVTSGHDIGTVTVDGTTTTFKETVIGVAPTSTPAGKGYTVTKEDGNVSHVVASQFISADAGNSVVAGGDGGIYFAATAQLPDDQVLTGDNTGSVSVTLTPSAPGVGGQIDYTIKSDLKIAATTPAATENTNLLKKNGSNETYVDMQDIATALNMTLGLNTTSMKLELKRGATVVSSVDVQDFTDLGGTTGTFYMLKA